MSVAAAGCGAIPPPAVPYQRVKDSLDAWEKIGAGPVILNWIKNGYKLPFIKRLKPFKYPPLIHSQEETAALQEILEKLLAIGAVEVTADDSFVSRSRLEPKKDGGYRLVVDLRHVNKHLAEQSCKFETLRDLQHVIRAQDWMISCDLENGYYHVPIHPQHRRYLTTTINGTVVQFNALPFGLSTAPRVFTKFMRPVVAHLRSLGIRMLQYLDDSLFMSQSRESLLEMRKYIDNLLCSLGLTRKPSKGVWEPTMELKHLGVQVDTKRGLFLVPMEKQRTITGAARSLLTYAKSHRRWVSVKKLAKLCGTVLAVSIAMPLARTVTRSLYDAISLKKNWASDVQLSKQALRDLQFLVDLPIDQCDKAIWKPTALNTVHTDASDTGWGAVLNNMTPAQGFFKGPQAHQHITAKELRAVLNALDSFHQRLQKKSVLKVITDNMSVRAVLNKGVSASPHLMRIYRMILERCLKQGILLQAEYIPTHDNVHADALSRIDPSSDWSLPQHIFDEVQTIFGKRTCDRFASPESAKCRKYNSIVPHPESLGDAFASSWDGERNWICPPIALASRVVERLLQEGAEAVLALPYWPSAPWFPALMEIADSTRILTHEEMLEVTPVHEDYTPDIRRNSKWRLMLVHVPQREWTPVHC